MEYIVYHGTDTKFNRFSLKTSTQGILWFTSKKENILNGNTGAGKNFILKCKITIDNPCGWEEYEKYSLGQVKSMGYDGILLDDDFIVFKTSQVKIIGRETILESAPSDFHKSTTWFHGTSLKAGMQIASDGFLRPSQIVTSRTKRFMAPVYNRVYLTHNVEEALGYAKFPSSEDRRGVLVIVKGENLKDIQPDEDIIADLIPDYNTNEDGSHKYPWLVRIANDYYPKDLEKYNKRGDYAYGTALGKKLVKHLSDKQKHELIAVGKKIATEGEIKVDKVFVIDFNDGEEITAENYLKHAKVLESVQALVEKIILDFLF